MDSWSGPERRRVFFDTMGALPVATRLDTGRGPFDVVADGGCGRICSDDRICLPARLLGATTANAKHQFLHLQISTLGRLAEYHVPCSTNGGRCACVMPTIKPPTAATWSHLLQRHPHLPHLFLPPQPHATSTDSSPSKASTH